MRGRRSARRGVYGAQAPVGTRDPFAWPFLSTSIWNTPIGSGAVYTPFYATQTSGAGPSSENPLPGLRGPGMGLDGSSMPGGYWTWLGYGCDYAFNVTTRVTDPLRTVYVQHAWGPGRATGTDLQPKWPGGSVPWQIHIPDSMVIPDASGGATPNAVGALIQPDGSIYNFNVMCRPVAGDNAFHAYTLGQIIPGWYTEAQVDLDANVRSTGVWGNHGASCLSGYGGCLMPGELTGAAPIHHALGMAINGAEYLFYDWNAYPYGGYLWPAVTQDADAPGADYYGGYHGHYPALRMGSLLAVPPGVTESSLGLTTVPAKKIFHALQDYGVYITDDTGWSEVDFNVDTAAANEFATVYGYGPGGGNPYASWGTSNRAYYDDLYSIGTSLMVVSNNGPSSIGGGGVPRVAPAPPFAP